MNCGKGLTDKNDQIIVGYSKKKVPQIQVGRT